MKKIAVIDTETTWGDEVMSVGVAIANAENFALLDTRYYILTPFASRGGMYTCALYVNDIRPDSECTREDAMAELTQFLARHEIDTMFAYNAAFDFKHMPELSYLTWYDIMKMAAYRQYNPMIPVCADCYGTGRLKHGYGVESIYRMLSGDSSYCEKHNALTDAVDELTIMRLLKHGVEEYGSARIG